MKDLPKPFKRKLILHALLFGWVWNLLQSKHFDGLQLPVRSPQLISKEREEHQSDTISDIC